MHMWEHICIVECCVSAAQKVTVFHAAGFAAAVDKALLEHNYYTYAYICAGAMEYGTTDALTTAFANVGFSFKQCCCQ